MISFVFINFYEQNYFKCLFSTQRTLRLKEIYHNSRRMLENSFYSGWWTDTTFSPAEKQERFMLNICLIDWRPAAPARRKCRIQSSLSMSSWTAEMPPSQSAARFTLSSSPSSHRSFLFRNKIHALRFIWTWKDSNVGYTECKIMGWHLKTWLLCCFIKRTNRAARPRRFRNAEIQLTQQWGVYQKITCTMGSLWLALRQRWKLPHNVTTGSVQLLVPVWSIRVVANWQEKMKL